ncbi:MAG: ABC transporter ATP-binding protein [Phycisphaerales bacterium]
MPRPLPSSRRFRAYLEAARQRQKASRHERTALSREGSEKSLKRTRGFGTLLRTFLGMLGRHRGAIFFSLGTLTLSTILGLVPPAATKFAIDYAFSGTGLPEAWRDRLPSSWDLADPKRLLLFLCLGVVAISLVRLVIGVAGRWQATRASRRLAVDMRRLAFDHAVRLPLGRVQELKSGGVASILREDAGSIADLVFSMLYNPWRAIIQLLGSLAILAATDWRLLLGSLALLPTVWFTHRTWIGRIRPMYRDIRNQRQAIDAQATETFAGMRVVRGFARQRSEANRFVRGGHLMARQELRVWWWARGVEIAWELIIPAASAALLFYGGLQVLDGTITTGDLVMFLTYLVMLLGPIETLASSATGFQTQLAALDRVLDLVDEPEELPDRPGARAIEPAQVEGRIEFRDVSFRYPKNDELVLDGISFAAEPGMMVALVGASGAGKTTLSNLVARFFDPTSGAILLDGVDLRDLRLAHYRRLLGIVEQDVFLFDGTLAENIAYGSRGATIEAIRRAAEIANAAEFIEAMPERYETLIGERGVRLSGGQRQRIAIARAVLADPRILILDEATSALDTESERLIQQGLERLLRDRTSFVIAHRLSTIAHADLIVVLRHGRIAETGTHESLMASSGLYREMVLRQTAAPERAKPIRTSK